MSLTFNCEEALEYCVLAIQIHHCCYTMLSAARSLRINGLGAHDLRQLGG